MEKKLEQALAGVHKAFGKGSVMLLGSGEKLEVDVIPTGIEIIDRDILLIGGIPKGRVTEIFGTECLDAGTFVPFATCVNQRVANGKGGTIERLYERFHNLPASGDGRGKHLRAATKNAEFFTSSVNELGRIVRNKILDVVDSGMKECYVVKTEKGNEITASENHQFSTLFGFFKLSDLSPGCVVYIHNNTPFSVEEYKDTSGLRFMQVRDKIVSITPVGPRKTYDIKMADPYNNFVANRFVVHNSGGKTTLTLQIIAQAQKAGGQALFIDAEHAFDPVYARALGVNTDDLLISQPECGEEALEIAENLIKSGEISIVVVDSVSALVPRAELEGEMGQPQMGLQARLLGQAMRKLTGVVSKTGTSLVFINQIREKLGIVFGNPETTSGGRALKFYASVRLDIRRTKAIKKGDEVIGAETKCKAVKNKCGSPYREAIVNLIYGRGFVNE